MVADEVELQATSKLYLHNIEICGSPDFEKELLKMVAKMYSQQTITTKGEVVMKPNDINCFVQERKINIKCHNTWHEICDDRVITLKKPDRFGIYSSDGIVEFKEFLANEYVSLIFELFFTVVIQGNQTKTFMLGYELHLPERNDIGGPKDSDINLKLLKGPN